jgi:glycosyltransferase involved in cell wall biosynthesis
MKLLVLTQKMDKKDPVLGFFHEWVERLSPNFEKISVVCLERGESSLPENVEVFSLGKEKNESVFVNHKLSSKVKYVFNFYKYIWKLNKDYDAVFVHMNQEYVLLGGILWKILGKKIYFWRNHPEGNILTRIAACFAHTIFYTSEFSYTAKFRKAEKMPAGIDTERFKDLKIERLKDSILLLGRIAPIKRLGLLIEALDILSARGKIFVCDIYGDPLSEDQRYYEGLKDRTKSSGLGAKVRFYQGLPNYETPKIYNKYETFVNLTPSGSLDKTILEAAACGCLPVVANESFRGQIDEKLIIAEETPESLAETLSFWLKASEGQKRGVSERLEEYVGQVHGLDALIEKLVRALKGDE